MGFEGLKGSRCRYKLVGFHSSWIFTKHHDEANFTNLEPGIYRFEVQASNNENLWNSHSRVLTIEILPPWWQTWWFYMVSSLAIVALIIAIIKYRLSKIRKEEKEMASQELQKIQLELKVLRSQMNPHFMFNALNSIENFIWKNEIKQASDYLGKFARLMRLVLENSHFETVGLDKELEALECYMQLEALRMDHKFTYKIENNLNADPSEIQIVPMLMQPFVENAILHGLLPKDGKGKLTIKIDMIVEDKIKVEIEDDGVGRSYRRTTESAGIHHSMGMKLTLERVRKINNGDINSVQIIDLTNDGSACGTLVKIILPIYSNF